MPQSMPKTLVALLLSVMAFRADAAVHVWTGAASNLVSNAANWRGGSPAGDPAAELIFPFGAARIAVTNDVATLTLRTLSITGSGYTIDGLPIALIHDAEVVDSSTGPNTIACDLELAGGVTFRNSSVISSYDDGGLIISGAIHGTGPVVNLNSSRLTFSGTRPNTYSGVTRVHGSGELRLAKSDGVAAIGGDLRIENATVTLLTSEQIPDSASLHVNGVFGTTGVETVGPMTVERDSYIQASDADGAIPFIGRLILAGDVTILPGDGYPIEFGTIALAGTRTFNSCAECSTVTLENVVEHSPGSGLILRGGPFEVYGQYHGATLIEEARARVFNLNSTARLRGGSFSGEVASLVSERGIVDATDSEGVRTSGDLRLNGATTVHLALGESGIKIFAGGALDLGRATLRLISEPYPRTLGATYLVGIQAKPGPIAGTFGGLPEGAVLAGRYRISYGGGDGNDLTLTAIGRLETFVALSASDRLLTVGEKTTLTAQAGSSSGPVRSGTITFRDGTTVLATLPVDANGRASIEVQPSWGLHVYRAQYVGTDTLAPSEEVWETVEVVPPAPSITSVDPTTVQGGTTVTVTVRGTDFYRGGTIELSGSSVPTTYISPTEVRFTWEVPRFSIDVMRNVSYRQPPPLSRESNLVPIEAKAASPATSPLTFEPRAISGPVAAGGGAAWMSVAFRRVNFSTTFERRTAITPDTDRDGRARWEQSDDVPSTGIWLMTDLTDGHLVVSRPNGDIPSRRAFPHAMFLRDEQGRYTHMVLQQNHTYDVLWVRPGTGAWTMTLMDGGETDLEVMPDGYGVYNTAQMRPVGDSPAPPAELAPGDVFAGIDWTAQHWFGDRVDEHLRESDGPGTLLLIHPHNVTEGAYGTATVRVLRIGGSDGTISADYKTIDDTALAGVHYEARAGRLTFGPGEILKTFEIPILDDEIFSGFTNLKLALIGPNVATTQPGGVIQLNDDEEAPALLADDVTVVEGDGGRREVTFTFRVTGPTRLPVTAQWSYPDAGSGRTVTGELTFLPGGPTSQTIVVSYEANDTPEPDRIIYVSLFHVVNAGVVDDGTITVVDDDVVEITVLDATVSESRDSVLVRLATAVPGTKPVTVRYATADGSATAGRDYSTTTGTVTFTDETTVHIPILRDSNVEGDESFTLELSNVTDGQLRRSSATVIILDDDSSAVPAITASSPTMVERNANRAVVQFRLSFPVQHEVRFRAATAYGSATAADFFARNEIVVISAGQTEAQLVVTVVDDSIVEGTETFSVVLSEPAGATIATPSVLATIVDGDRAFATSNVTITAVDIVEGAIARFTVRLDRTPASAVTLPYATAEGSAVAGSDYHAVAGTLTFAPGETTKIVDVATINDEQHEFDETFALVVGNASAMVSVLDHDPVPPPRKRAVRH